MGPIKILMLLFISILGNAIFDWFIPTCDPQEFIIILLVVIAAIEMPIPIIILAGLVGGDPILDVTYHCVL